MISVYRFLQVFAVECCQSQHSFKSCIFCHCSELFLFSKMSSVEAPIGLKTQLADLPTTVQLERYVQDTGGVQVRRRVRCPVINNENDPELACRIFEEFSDIAGDNRLHLK